MERQALLGESDATHCVAPFTDVHPEAKPQTASDWRELHITRSLSELRELSAQAPAPPSTSDLSFAPLTRRSSSYPEELLNLKAFPPILWFRGDVSLLQRRAIGLCGSRQASAEGLR